MKKTWLSISIPPVLVTGFLLLSPYPAAAGFILGPEQLVEADGSVISVPGYSVPAFVHWDGDDLKDLVIGQGGGGQPEGKVRVYLNVGTPGEPQFSSYFHAQSEESDLVCVASG